MYKVNPVNKILRNDISKNRDVDEYVVLIRWPNQTKYEKLYDTYKKKVFKGLYQKLDYLLEYL